MAEVTEAAYLPYVARLGRRPAPMSADYTAITDAGTAWVAERGGEVVGLIVVVPGNEHLVIETVAVMPDLPRSRR